MIATLNLLLTTLALLLLVYWMLGIKHRLRQIRRTLDQLQGHVWNTALLMRALPETALLPAPSGYTAAGDLLVELISLVRNNKPQNVVELGSGLSTLVIAATLREQGHGKLVSIEHDQTYATKTQYLLDSSGLNEWAEIRVAPLRAQMIDGVDVLWYDSDSLKDLKQIELLFVDGPPAPLSPGIRAPALGYFWPRMAAGGNVVMDDADREAEKRAIVEWDAANPDASVQWLPLQKGCAIIQKAT